MLKILACHTVLFGLLFASGPVSATPAREAIRRARADYEQGRPLWSLCEPRRAPVDRTARKRLQSLPAAHDVGPSLSDCAGIDGADQELIAQGGSAHAAGGMSGQFDEEDEAPICGGGAQCSPVPTERSHAISGLNAAKAIVPPARLLGREPDSRRPPPRSLGAADDGHPRPPFEPPRAERPLAV